ncbi:MAG: histidine phosphatase family protein [Ilumatobacter sp.]|nr:histidine phosphatase family protein [Ilumatobacter sp.]
MTHGTTRVVLIRHGESQVTVDRVIGGHRTCSGLSDLGRQQAARLHDRLAGTHELDGAVLISSNFDRAIETAQIIGPAIAGADLLIDPGFGEHDPGPELDGTTFDAYVDRFGSPDWGGDPHYEVFPGGGETIARFQLRVGSTLSKTLATHPGRTVAISCHGGVVDAIFRQLLRTAPTGTFDLWTTNTSLTEFVSSQRAVESATNSKWRLVRYNDAAHLAGLPSATNSPAQRRDG